MPARVEVASAPLERELLRPPPSKLWGLQRGLVELAYLFAQAEMLSHSVALLDNTKVPYDEFRRRAETAARS